MRHENLNVGLEALIARYERGIDEVSTRLSSLVPEAAQEDIVARRDDLVKAGVPNDLAERIAWQRHLQRAPDVVKISEETGASIERVAATLYASAADLGVDRMIFEGSKLAAKDFVERQAINRLLTQVFNAHRSLVATAVREASANEDAWEKWKEHHATTYARAQTALSGLLSEKTFTLARLTVAQGVLYDLANA